VAGLSPFHFHRVIQATFGETPADFAKRLRLERALAMMAGPRPPSLTSIAIACGFSSSSDFSRSFKQRFGAPPRRFDIEAWRRARGGELDAVVADQITGVDRLQPRENPDGFRVRIRDLPTRTAAYIRVANPYRGDGVQSAAERLVSWAERHGLADGQWLGYQWDNPEVTALKDCRYYVAVVAEGFAARGEIGRHRFPPMTVVEVEMRGGIDLELRLLRWLYGVWLPRSGYIPDDQPCFEAFLGRPFAHGGEHFELAIQLPVRRR
jgi:AraC family transcriptional regulator